jgi:Flp pilus assembly protein TadD
MIQKADYKAGVRHLEEAIRIRPDHAEALTNLGSALLQQGKLDEAERRLKQVLRIKPLPAAHHNLALLYARQGKLQEAVFHYRQALAAGSGDAWIHNDLGLAFYSLQDFEKAFFHLSEALRLDSGNLKIRHNLFIIRNQMERTRNPASNAG